MKVSSARQEGFAVVSLLIMVGALYVLISAGTLFTLHLTRLQSRSNFLDNVANVSTTIKLTYRRGAVCDLNLAKAAIKSANGGTSAPAPFGTTLAELIDNSVSGKLALVNPDTSTSTPGYLMAPQQPYKSVYISSLSFSPIQRVFAKGTGNQIYLAKLHVVVTPTDNKVSAAPMTREATAPFYIITDANDKIVDCYVTTMADEHYSFEDKLCQQYGNGATSRYSPNLHRCEKDPAQMCYVDLDHAGLPSPADAVAGNSGSGVPGGGTPGGVAGIGTTPDLVPCLQNPQMVTDSNGKLISASGP